VPIESAYVTSY